MVESDTFVSRGSYFSSNVHEISLSAERGKESKNRVNANIRLNIKGVEIGRGNWRLAGPPILSH